MAAEGEKITYLFGAGASAKALPVVSQFSAELKGFLNDITTIREFAFEDTERFEVSKLKMQDVKTALIMATEWLIKSVDEHASIDTYAKKLSLTGGYDDLKKLKAVLTIFFIYLQNKKPFDKRYDTFFASIVSDIHKLPSNLNILSWNYDTQFETAFNQYYTNQNLYSIQARLSITPNGDQIHFGTKIQTSPEGFHIFKLNGTTSFYNRRSFDINTILPNVLHDLNHKTFGSIIEFFHLLTMDQTAIDSLMAFAWERNDMTKQVIDNAIVSTKDTTRLVCIGYSFPFFNRSIDRKIINSMGNLKTVYFQNLKEDVNDVMDRFSAIRQDIKALRPITDSNQFFLPPEL